MSDGADSILIVGGDQDPNLHALRLVCEQRGLPVRTLFIAGDNRPRLLWDFERRAISVDGHELCARAAFIRHDVFADMARPDPVCRATALSWFTTFAAFFQLSQIRTPNRSGLFRGTSKIVALDLARAAGLLIPRTWISNDQEWIAGLSQQGEAAIAKPVNGGCYTRNLGELAAVSEHRSGCYAAPAFVQSCLSYPEYRVFIVGEQAITFRIESETIDYRSNADAKVVLLDGPPQGTYEPLISLCRTLGLDFAAADFKSDPVTGAAVFLEINDAPMFAAFDRVGDGRVGSALAGWLADNRD